MNGGKSFYNLNLPIDEKESAKQTARRLGISEAEYYRRAIHKSNELNNLTNFNSAADLRARLATKSLERDAKLRAFDEEKARILKEYAASENEIKILIKEAEDKEANLPKLLKERLIAAKNFWEGARNILKGKELGTPKSKLEPNNGTWANHFNKKASSLGVTTTPEELIRVCNLTDAEFNEYLDSLEEKIDGKNI